MQNEILTPVIVMQNIKQLINSKQLILNLVKANQAENSQMNLKALSRLLGRNDAYLHQYIHRNSPKLLPERIRHKLAELLGTDERFLREDGWQDNAQCNHKLGAIQAVPVLTTSEDNLFDVHYFDINELLKLVEHQALSSLRMARLTDDDMAPDLPKDTLVMLDPTDTQLQEPGLYLLGKKNDFTLREVHIFDNEDINQDEKPKNQVRLTAKNPAIGAVRVTADTIPVIGKVIWFARALCRGLET